MLPSAYLSLAGLEEKSLLVIKRKYPEAGTLKSSDGRLWETNTAANYMASPQGETEALGCQKRMPEFNLHRHFMPERSRSTTRTLPFLSSKPPFYFVC